MAYVLDSLVQIDTTTSGYKLTKMQAQASAPGRNYRPVNSDNPVFGFYIHRGYITEFEGVVRTTPVSRHKSRVKFYFCGPYDGVSSISINPDTGEPQNIPIIKQVEVVNDAHYANPDDEEYETVSAAFNIGSEYGTSPIVANEVYILFIARVYTEDSPRTMYDVSAVFETTKITDDSPPPDTSEWYLLNDPWYASVNTSGFSESIYVPDHNILCFPIDHESKDGSWTVTVSTNADVIVGAGFSYKWESQGGILYVAQISSPGKSFSVSDISAAYSYIWIRFVSGQSSGNIDVNISFMETVVEKYWHSETTIPVSMNNGAVLPASGSETWSNGLGEKGVLVYRFKLSENFAPEFSYSGSQSMWMCISTVPDVNSLTGMPEPASAVRGQGNGTSFTVTASEVLTAGTWYYLFIETITGDPYSGQIVITYGAAPPPEPEWFYGDNSDQTDILATTYRDVTLTAQTGVRFRVSFRFSGAASFSVSGATDAYIYATTGDYGFSKTTGRPKDINGNELSDGTSTSVFVAGTGYYTYIWVRGQDADTAGTVTVTITPPTALWTETEDGAGAKSVTVKDEYFVESYPLSIQQLMVYRYELTFSKSGTVQIYSVGSTETSDVIAYFSSVPRNFNRTLGRPESYDKEWNNAGSGNYDFNSGALEVTAGTTYYLWVRGIDTNTTASISVNISGGSSSGGKKVWVYTTSGWKQAVPWVYTTSGWKQTT